MSTAVRPYRDERSGKIVGLNVRNDQFGKDLDFPTLQERLGSEMLRSSDFEVTDEGSDIIVKGYGKGDGVGLCVYSAKKMAERGDHAAQILQSFLS